MTLAPVCEVPGKMRGKCSRCEMRRVLQRCEGCGSKVCGECIETKDVNDQPVCADCVEAGREYTKWGIGGPA